MEVLYIRVIFSTCVPNPIMHMQAVCHGGHAYMQYRLTTSQKKALSCLFDGVYVLVCLISENVLSMVPVFHQTIHRPFFEKAIKTVYRTQYLYYTRFTSNTHIFKTCQADDAVISIQESLAQN